LIYYKTPTLFAIALLLVACPDNKTQTADCNTGFIPCEDDPSECCEVVCDEGYHLCANDSTECCTDTTTHNFIWTVDTLGLNGKYLNDVAIIAEDDIWVVGALIIEDSTLQYPTQTNYNAAHWNGELWELILIDRNVTFETVYAFGNNDIWFSDGCFIYFYDGQSFTKKWECDWETYGPGQANSIWGNSSNNIYFAGRNGSFTHYNGTNFERITSPTNIDFTHISGLIEEETIFIAGHNISGESTLLKYEDDVLETLYLGENLFTIPYGMIKSVTVIDSLAIIGCTEGIWYYNINTDSTSFIDIEDIGLSSIYSIDGNAVNDFTVLSNWGSVVHFNGASWTADSQVELVIPNEGSFYSRGIKYQGNIECIVGLSTNLQGVVAIGNK